VETQVIVNFKLNILYQKKKNQLFQRKKHMVAMFSSVFQNFITKVRSGSHKEENPVCKDACSTSTPVCKPSTQIIVDNVQQLVAQEKLEVLSKREEGEVEKELNGPIYGCIEDAGQYTTDHHHFSRRREDDEAATMIPMILHNRFMETAGERGLGGENGGAIVNDDKEEDAEEMMLVTTPPIPEPERFEDPKNEEEEEKEKEEYTYEDVREGSEEVKQKVTALMVRNIPYKYTPAEFYEDLGRLAFQQQMHIDSAYIPIDKNTGSNLGYAFVNVTKPEYARSLRNILHKQRLPRYYNKNALEVVDSATGVLVEHSERNVEHLAHSRKEHKRRSVTSRARSSCTTTNPGTPNTPHTPPPHCIRDTASPQGPYLTSSPTGATSREATSPATSTPTTDAMIPESNRRPGDMRGKWKQKDTKYHMPNNKQSSAGSTEAESMTSTHSDMAKAPRPSIVSSTGNRMAPKWPVREFLEATTLMIRHIPYRYTQRNLIEDIQAMGVELGVHMDFFYLPIDPKTASNLGYVFLNLVDEQALAKIWSLCGSRLPRYLKDTRKVLSVDVCSIQGYEKNWRHYEGSSTMNRLSHDRRPIFSHMILPPKAPRPIGQRQSRQQKSNAWSQNNRECSKTPMINAEATTFMLQNIRNYYTQESLISDLQTACHLVPGQDMDFLYLPTNPQRTGNLGYAFINFKNSQARERFTRLEFDAVPAFFQNKVERVADSVTVATIQGSHQNYRNLRKSQSSRSHSKPMFWGLNHDQLDEEVISPPPGLDIVAPREDSPSTPVAYRDEKESKAHDGSYAAYDGGAEKESKVHDGAEKEKRYRTPTGCTGAVGRRSLPWPPGLCGPPGLKTSQAFQENPLSSLQPWHANRRGDENFF